MKKKRLDRNSLVPPPFEDTVRKARKAVCGLGSQVAPDSQFVKALVLDFAD